MLDKIPEKRKEHILNGQKISEDKLWQILKPGVVSPQDLVNHLDRPRHVAELLIFYITGLQRLQHLHFSGQSTFCTGVFSSPPPVSADGNGGNEEIYWYRQDPEYLNKFFYFTASSHKISQKRKRPDEPPICEVRRLAEALGEDKLEDEEDAEKEDAEEEDAETKFLKENGLTVFRVNSATPGVRCKKKNQSRFLQTS